MSSTAPSTRMTGIGRVLVIVYAVMALMLNAAGVRDVARRLLARRQDAPA